MRANLGFHGFPLKIEDQPPGNVKYIYEKASATGPYTRPAGAYTRYGDVLPLLSRIDDKFVVFGSGDEVALDFDPATLPRLPDGWVRDYFFIADGYEKDMDFYAYRGDTVTPLPFGDMKAYPYPEQAFPSAPRSPELPARVQHAIHVRKRSPGLFIPVSVIQSLFCLASIASIPSLCGVPDTFANRALLPSRPHPWFIIKEFQLPAWIHPAPSI